MALSLSVKQKILLSLWVITLLLLVLFGSVASVWIAQDQAGRIDAFLTREIRSTQETLEAYFATNIGEDSVFDLVSTVEFRAFLDRYLKTRLNNPAPYKTTLGIFDSKGARIQASNLALDLNLSDFRSGSSFQLITALQNPPYRVAIVPLTYNGQSLGTVRLACLTPTLSQVWGSLVFSLSMVLGLAFLAFGLLGTVLINWAMRPVRRLSLSAQKISESQLNLRLTVPPGRDEVSQMASTLNNLLAKLELDFEFEEALVGQLSHELRTPLSDLDLKSILADLIEELEPLWDAKDLSLEYLLPQGATTWPRCPVMQSRGDRVLLHQVFLNVLTNAFKYAPRGSLIHLTIEAAGTNKSPLWRLEFRNSGPTIPESSLELIFKRFYRVESQDPDHVEQASGLAQKGFGLGLSLARAMLNLQDGTIRAFNPTQGGASFEILVPRIPTSTKKTTQGVSYAENHEFTRPRGRSGRRLPNRRQAKNYNPGGESNNTGRAGGDARSAPLSHAKS